MDTAKVTEIQRKVLSICSVSCAGRHLIVQCALAVLILLSPVVSSNAPPLTTDQVIQKLQQQFNGKVISISLADNDHFYHVRFLTGNAQVRRLKIDAVSGKIVEQATSPR